MIGIRVNGVSAGYLPELPILKEVSVTVDRGSIVTILGPNGSGKSTLLRAIMGYVPLSAGDVLVDGNSVHRAPVHERALGHGLAYVPQLGNVFGPLSVRENLEVGGARLSGKARRRRVAQLLELYPALAERERQRADSQSGGERQILAIARALMTEPRYLLLDEPSAGLSPLMTERLFEMLHELRERHGVTILLVEQNAVQSLEIADRGLVLVLGSVALAGEASSILADPRVSELYLGGPAPPSSTPEEV